MSDHLARVKAALGRFSLWPEEAEVIGPLSSHPHDTPLVTLADLRALVAEVEALREALRGAVEYERARFERDERIASAHNNSDGVGIHYDYLTVEPVAPWYEKAARALDAARRAAQATEEG